MLELSRLFQRFSRSVQSDTDAEILLLNRARLHKFNTTDWMVSLSRVNKWTDSISSRPDLDHTTRKIVEHPHSETIRAPTTTTTAITLRFILLLPAGQELQWAPRTICCSRPLLSVTANPSVSDPIPAVRWNIFISQSNNRSYRVCCIWLPCSDAKMVAMILRSSC